VSLLLIFCFFVGTKESLLPIHRLKGKVKDEWP